MAERKRHTHKLAFTEHCTAANSGIVASDNYERTVCSCGHRSAPSQAGTGIAIDAHESHARRSTDG